MSFFDSLKKGFNEESERINESKQRSNYKTLLAKEWEHFDNLNSQSDGALLSKFNSIFISDNDKEIIVSILEGRGYKKNNKGQFDR